jgi:putative colanic acid biosynthesis acetyltransferase WcaB
MRRHRRTHPATGDASLLRWLGQDLRVNAGRPDSQLVLVWFRLAQWALHHWGLVGRALIGAPYFLCSSLIVGCELPAAARIGPRLRLYHPHAIVLSPHTTIGADCRLRHGVTVGNRTDRDGRELGVATLGDGVELGAGCAVIGAVHVGDHARVGALALVTKPVPAWAVVAGNPARVLRVEAPGEPVSTSIRRSAA